MVMIQRPVILLVFLSCLGIVQKSFSLSGFDRVYNPHNGVTIDLVHDSHLCNTTLTPEELNSAEPALVESTLAPSEKKFMEVLRTLHLRGNYHEVDLIWEHLNTQGVHYNQFLAFSDRLVRNRLRNLHYIDGDRWRREFIKLFSLPPYQRRSSGTSFSSFQEPYRVPDVRIAGILQSSGDVALEEFQEFSSVVRQRLSLRLGRDNFGERYFGNTVSPFAAETELGWIPEIASITDVEMLSRILSSTKKHIIVFAGGWHTLHLSSFLTERLGYQLVEYVRPDGRGFLDKIGQLSRPVSQPHHTRYSLRRSASRESMQRWVAAHSENPGVPTYNFQDPMHTR